jgi:hypothetical protein
VPTAETDFGNFRLGCGRLLYLAATITRRRQHTRVPLPLLSVGATEPSVARRAVYGRRVVANRVAG